MNRIEKLMSKYQNIEFKFDKSMPLAFGGYTVGNRVIINANLSESEQYQWMFEELGHIATSIGDISNYDATNNMKQELEARKWGYKQSMTRSQLDKIRKCYAENDYEVADVLGIQVDYLHEVGRSYGLHYKHVR